MRRSAVLFLAVLILSVAAGMGCCQDAYQVEAESPVSLRALVDVRFVIPGKAPSWTDNGPGKARYGGRSTAGGSERVTRFALSQFALEPEASLPWDIQAHAQLNWEGDVDDNGDITNDHWPLLIEAYLRKEWGDWSAGWGVQSGVLSVPFSLEHTGPAWTSPYTLTPSALNTWLWDDQRIVGAEAEWWRVVRNGTRVGVFFGTGWGPDRTGSLLAQRGWVLSDHLSGVNSDLPLPQPGREAPAFDERDGRPAIYSGLSLHDPWEIGEFRLSYLDNLGDQGTQGVWETRYGTAGVVLHPLPRIELLFQYLAGETQTHVNHFDSRFSTFYPLLSYRYRGHRATVRYDNFRVEDEGGPPSSRERGDAVTLAYLFEFWLRHRVGVEYIFIDSHRPTASAPDPSDDICQISYRYRY